MTNYSSFYNRFIKKIFYTPEVEEYKPVRRVRERLPDTPFIPVSDKEAIPKSDRNQSSLFVTGGKGNKVGLCPGSRRHLCCNYVTVNLYEGCPIGCTYCIMKSYLNFLPVTVNVDTRSIIRELEAIISLNQGAPLRIGTGETGDSLFYDPLFELSQELVEFSAHFPNLQFELKTKTAFVDHLLGVKHKGRAVIGFSLNPPSLVGTEEGFAATVDERFAAAARACAAGYDLSFHFDPIIRTFEWEILYSKVVERLADFASERIAWISLGTMRYPGNLRDRLEERPYLFDEFVLCRDAKYRYLQPIRETMYKKIAGFIREKTTAPVYLCMESPAVWKHVFGKIPSKLDELCAIFSTVKVGD